MAHTSTARAWAQGGTIFGATMMIIIGVYQALMGIAAIVRDQFFVVAPNYVYEIDVTAWGWIHLGIGALLVLVGSFVFTGATWARWLGIAVTAISAIANFFFLPYYPLWSLLIIAGAAWVIWSLATTSLRGRHAVEPGDMSTMAATAGGPTAESERWTRLNVPGTGERAERDLQARPGEMPARPGETRMPTGTPRREDSTTQG